MPGDIDRLLKYIVHNYTAREEIKEVEREASAVDDIVAGRRRALREEEHRAEMLAAPFREGLRRADAARRAGGDAISLDDRDPQDNLIADALVHFLVGPGMATSSTRETEPMHYIYTISIDWDQVAAVARRANVDLDAVINRAGA